MPLEFPGGGVLKEHAAVRTAVGVFDVSHLGKVSVRGPGAAELVNQCLTNDLSRTGPGHGQYTLCCAESTGGVLDDLICYLSGPDQVLLVPNAANAATVVGLLAAAAPGGVEVADRHEEYGVLAVQGPAAFDLLEDLDLPVELAYLAFRPVRWRAIDLIVCRSGYTGERGVELLVPWAQAPAVWDALVERVPAYGGRPCGLGARDTLRLEMGYSLHGQDLTPEVTPVQARLGWAVGWAKPRFWGRAALLAEKHCGPARMLWGIEALDRAIPRRGMALRSAAGEPVGTVTSGSFSPTRRVGIGLALLDRPIRDGAELSVDVRGRPAPVRVVRPPFVTASPQ